ncbi:glutamate receptor 2-like [Limulus polyphemus]|uniref:Glutamate receptor 2-like n=1 Tax=Limulus polyphemus TaxID=6850 RepID=A0ABM1T784_LIMPO|nr:glutamate receptor 2-like [Limulus polyphemus]
MGTWWVFVVTIIAAYSGTLTSFMTNPGTQEPVDTIIELVDAIQAGEYSCGTIKDSSDHDLFKNPHSEAFSVILKSMESDPDNFVKRDKEGLAKCLKKKYAYIAGQLTVEADIEHVRKFRFAKDNFQISGYGMAQQKGFYFRTAFDKIILRLRQSGLVDKWIQEALERVRRNDDSSEESLKRSLKLTDLQGAFYVLFIGHGLSLAAFFTEKLHRRCLKKKNFKHLEMHIFVD